jgi:hypothetical protein
MLLAFLFEEAQEGLREYTKLMALGAGTAEDFADQMRMATPAMLEAARVAQPANIAYERVVATLEELGVVIPFDELEAFKNALLDEAAAADKAGVSNEEMARRMENLSGEFISANTEVSGASGFVDQFSGSIMGLVSRLAPALIAMTLLTKAFQAVKRFIQESIQVAMESAEAQRLLAAAVREHGRVMGELSPTYEEANEFAIMLSETYSRTRNEMRKLVTDSMLLTGTLKLTKGQTEGLSQAAVVMSESLGVDATSALRIFTNFLNTGYTTGLQRLGFSLNEQSLQVEAIKRGYIELGDELDEHTMKMVGLELITERTADLQTDLADGQQSLDERLEAANVRLETQREIVGERLTPAWIGLKEAIADVVELLVGTFDDAADRSEVVLAGMIARALALEDTLKAFAADPIGFDFFGAYEEFEQIRWVEQAEELFGLDLTPTTQEFRELTNEMKALAMQAKLSGEGMQEFSDEVWEAAVEAVPKLEKAAEQLADGLQRIDERLERTLLNIERQFSDRRLSLQLNLSKNLASIDKQAAESRLQTTLDFNLREEREEQDHILRMQRLEEDYLMNLDDAVRERDALAVLQLQRQHKLEKKRAEEDAGKAKRRRKEDFELELAEIERQRQIKRAAAIADFKERMERLAEEERIRAERAREDAEREKRLLEKHMNERVARIIKGLQSELNLTAEQLKLMFKLMDRFYGSDGWFVQLVSNYYKWLAKQGAPVSVDDYQGEGGGTGGTDQEDRLPRAFQRGGSFIATSPQLISVAESSPERVDITPLSGATGQPRGGGVDGDRGGTVEVQIGLDDGLVGEIVDQSMNEMANVVISINRGGRK